MNCNKCDKEITGKPFVVKRERHSFSHCSKECAERTKQDRIDGFDRLQGDKKLADEGDKEAELRVKRRQKWFGLK